MITGIDGPEVLKLMPVPHAGHVRVRVLAAGVAFNDVLMRHGLYQRTWAFAFTPGFDIVGTVDALGDGVSNFAVGQRVAALTRIGGYGEFAIVNRPLNLFLSRKVSIPRKRSAWF